MYISSQPVFYNGPLSWFWDDALKSPLSWFLAVSVCPCNPLTNHIWCFTKAFQFILSWLPSKSKFMLLKEEHTVNSHAFRILKTNSGSWCCICDASLPVQIPVVDQSFEVWLVENQFISRFLHVRYILVYEIFHIYFTVNESRHLSGPLSLCYAI